MSDQPGTTAGYDRSEPNARAIAVFGVVTLVLLVALLLGLEFYFDSALAQQVYIQVEAPVSETLTALRAREDEELHTYRFLDRDKGTVRLPIERAMELLVAEQARGRLFYPTEAVPVPANAQGGPNARR